MSGRCARWPGIWRWLSPPGIPAGNYPWPPLPPTRDEADHQGAFPAQVAYWKSALADLPAELPLPADRPRPPVTTYQGGSVPLRLDADLHVRLLDLGRESDADLFMVLQAGFTALLTRLGAGADIPVGTRIAGRRDGELDDAVGCFANTLVLRTDTSGDPGFLTLLGRVRKVNREARAHQNVPFEYLVDMLSPPRSMARHPLFQVTLAVEDSGQEGPQFAGLTAEPVPVDLATATVDLSFSLTSHAAADGTPPAYPVISFTLRTCSGGTPPR